MMLVRILLILIDSAVINLVFLISYFLRYGASIPDINFAPFRKVFLLITFIYVACMVVSKVYQSRFKTKWQLFATISKGVFLGTLLSVALVYVFRINLSKFPSSVFAISLPVNIALIYIVNFLILKFSGRIKKQIFVIGSYELPQLFQSSTIKEIHHINDVQRLLEYDDIDEVIIAEDIRNEEQVNLLIYLLTKLKVEVVFSPLVYAKLLSGKITKDNSLKFLATFAGKRSDFEEFLIRIFDVIASVFMFVPLSPLIFLICLLLKITGKSILYRQIRVGKDGGIFMLYKFRTMIENAESDTGPVLASRNDPRVTRLGRFLRSTRLDELPQLFNVIKGDMSLVGPRPERPHFVKQHRALRELRLAVKPGLTGLAQIRSCYDIRPKHKVKYDYIYIQNRTLAFNLYILWKTIPVLFSKMGW